MAAVLSGEREGREDALVATPDSDAATRMAELHRRAAGMAPMPGECATSIVARLLTRLSSIRPPDLTLRLRGKAATAAAERRALRVLSLDSGAAVAERALLANCEVPVDLVLTGDEETSLVAAQAMFHPRHRVTCRVTDLEAGLATWKDCFDVVVSHAALSRVTRLEPLLQDVTRLLTPAGELWVSREYVGPPDGHIDGVDADAASRLFATFPHRARAIAPAANGSHLPSLDSARGFGRHGDRLLPWLRRHFVAVEECANNALLWRALPPSIAECFDPGRAHDLNVLRAAVVADVLHAESGGRPAMLDGVYTARLH